MRLSKRLLREIFSIDQLVLPLLSVTLIAVHRSKDVDFTRCSQQSNGREKGYHDTQCCWKDLEKIEMELNEKTFAILTPIPPPAETINEKCFLRTVHQGQIEPSRNSLAELFFDLKNPKMAPMTADESKSRTRRT